MYLPVLLWSLVIFASFWGYGEALRRALKRPEFDDLGWGLAAAWGMAVTLAIGGFLMMFSLAKAPMLTGVVLAGAALALYFVAQRLANTTNSQPAAKKSKSKKGKATEEGTSTPKQATHAGYPTVIANVLLWSLAALAFASSIAWPHHIDPNDDLICYLMLPLKLLETGTLIEPFSFQRAGTFGGQALLQALVMIAGNERNGHVPDRGIAMLMLFGILLHATRGLRGKQAFVRFLLLLALWLVPVPRISTHGAIDGGCLLVAMLITREMLIKTASKAWTGYIPVGLLLAGACCIRPTFTVAAGGMLAALFIKDILTALKSKENILNVISKYFITIGIAFIILIPFMVVLYASNGTPMIPPFSGHVSKAYQIYAYNEFWKDMNAVAVFYSTPESICMIAMLAVAAFFSFKKDAVWIAGGAVLATSVIVNRYGAMAYLDQYRFAYPLLVPLALWLLSVLLQNSTNPLGDASTYLARTRKRFALWAAALSLLSFIFVNAGQGIRELREQLNQIPQQIAEVKPFFDPNLRTAYKNLQNLVPADAKILTMVDASYWFDFKRNTIYSINAVGSSSPPPGMPFNQGPDALANYLKGLGIRYVIAVDFNNAILLYTRRLWTEATRPEWIYPQIWRPRFLDVMNNFDELEKKGTVVAKAANARLFDLGP
jgi:hypothetical protein